MTKHSAQCARGANVDTMGKNQYENLFEDY
jgi:hypothetical protein